MNIGDKLKLLRKERGLTQKEVSTALSISRSVYSQYENNEREPSLKRIIALARFYMVSLDYVCDNTERISIDITELSNSQKRKLFVLLREFYFCDTDN